MTKQGSENDASFRDVLQGLRNGDFSRLEPVFASDDAVDGGRSRILRWIDEGRFRDEPQALAEALSCACFLGRVAVAEALLNRKIDPSAGAGTGLNAFHWAANRGQLDAVRLLIRHKAPLETRNMHGGTVLGTAVWSAIHEPKRDHLRIIEALLDAGARREDSGYPTGDDRVDAVLRRGGA